ncbi:MAG: YigZ family protein [Bacteroidota bacterium]
MIAAEETYQTITKPAEGLFKDRGSKFMAYAFPVFSESDIKLHLSALRKKHHSARHHCYAYRLGPEIYRANDDGEPSNTAGKPILGQIQANDLTNILIVVVRYFGGKLLGTSGLINAYRSAAADALDNAEIITKTVNDIYEITFDYAVMNDVMKIIKQENLKQSDHDYQSKCKLILAIKRNKSDRIFVELKKSCNIGVKYLRTE